MTLDRDFHIHTVFSDGRDSPSDIAKEAFSRGLSAIGFSDHSYTAFDDSYCIKKADIQSYIETVTRLKDEYKGKMSILCGIEQDMYAGKVEGRFDYSIGSVHYITAGDEYIPVDFKPEILISAAQKHFEGDVMSVVERYYENAGRVISATGADIIGHFDLISKFNEGDSLFDSKSERYRAAWKNAVDRLIPEDKPFEINTGAISRGYRSEGYPSFEIAEYIKSRGGRFILSSDSHKKENLCFGFKEYESRYKGCIVAVPK